MSLTEDEVVVCNQSVDLIGGKVFTYAVQTGVEALKCIRAYPQTRNMLLRKYGWPFASVRVALEIDTQDPAFEYDHRFRLPSDFVRFKEDYTHLDNPEDDKFEIEGDYLLCNDSEVEIKYVKKITDPTKFDPLFTEMLILTLAKKLISPIVGTKNPTLVNEIKQDLAEITRSAIAACRQETNTSGYRGWNYAHQTFDTSP